MEKFKIKNKKQFEIKCLKEMLESCFAYEDISDNEKFRKTHCYDQYVKQYERILGKETFDKIYNEHLDYLRKNFTVLYNTSTDGEGCTYNTLQKIS